FTSLRGPTGSTAVVVVNRPIQGGVLPEQNRDPEKLEYSVDSFCLSTDTHCAVALVTSFYPYVTDQAVLCRTNNREDRYQLPECLRVLVTMRQPSVGDLPLWLAQDGGQT